jgi:hypothetical protein
LRPTIRATPTTRGTDADDARESSDSLARTTPLTPKHDETQVMSDDGRTPEVTCR